MSTVLLLDPLLPHAASATATDISRHPEAAFANKVPLLLLGPGLASCAP
jgi:hypothetical protein